MLSVPRYFLVFEFATPAIAYTLSNSIVSAFGYIHTPSTDWLLGLRTVPTKITVETPLLFLRDALQSHRFMTGLVVVVKIYLLVFPTRVE